MLKLGPPVLGEPYGEVGRPELATLLAMDEGVFLNEGPMGEVLLFGIDMLGLLPANVVSEGFFDHGNISAPGIFQPVLQPVCVPARATTTRLIRVQFASFVRMLTIPFGSL
jgi:hypothetical protein